MPAPVVLFDGVCNLCNASVNFILDRERGRDLTFAPLQSETAKALLGEVKEYSSVIFVEEGEVYRESTAALRIARHLRAPWRWLSVLRFVVPRFLRDAVYRLIARNRYRWFGTSETCRVPTPELRTRFLS